MNYCYSERCYSRALYFKFLMQIWVALGNRKKVIIVSSFPFASSLALSTHTAKTNTLPSLLLFLLTTPPKKKKFWKIPSSNSSILCITAFLLWFVFLSHVSFQAVPNASQKDQEKLLLQKHQEKLWSIILLLLPQARWTPLYCSLPLTISSILVVRKWWDLWKYRCTELFCPVCQYVQFLEYYIIIISTWEVYLTTDMQGQKGKKKKKGGGQVEKDHGNLITNDENNTLMKDLSFPSTTETM